MIAGTLANFLSRVGGDPAVSDAVRAAADVVARRLGKLKPGVAIGSVGPGRRGQCGARRRAIRTRTFRASPSPGAPGHKGELVGGTLEGVRSSAERSLSFV